MVGSRVKDRNRGFTVLELFIITIIVAAKSYHDDSGGSFPPSNDDPAFLSYFPGGSCDQKGTRAGNFPINPFTNRPEAPRRGHVTNVDQERTGPPKELGQAGQIFYSPISAEGSDEITSFAIEGADRDGRSIAGPKPNTSLVLSEH